MEVNDRAFEFAEREHVVRAARDAALNRFDDRTIFRGTRVADEFRIPFRRGERLREPILERKARCGRVVHGTPQARTQRLLEPEPRAAALTVRGMRFHRHGLFVRKLAVHVGVEHRGHVSTGAHP